MKRMQSLGLGDEAVSLGGEVDDEDFLAIMDGLDRHRPDRDLGRACGDDSVRGFDVLRSPQTRRCAR